MINNCLRLFPSLEANLEALQRLHLSLGFLKLPPNSSSEQGHPLNR